MTKKDVILEPMLRASAKSADGSNSSRDTSANLGFEATARRCSASPRGEAILRNLEGSLWLSAVSRNAVETADGNRSNNMDAAEPLRSGDSQSQATRWPQIQSRAKLPSTSKHVDDAIAEDAPSTIPNDRIVRFERSTP